MPPQGTDLLLIMNEDVRISGDDHADSSGIIQKQRAQHEQKQYDDDDDPLPSSLVLAEST